MRKSFITLLIFSLLVSSVVYAFPQKKKSRSQLSPYYKKWLEEEVVYIITPREKEVFLQLETDRERAIFEEAFWRQRDPVPETPANEFKDEHYRRIKYANEHFGRHSPGPGWRSDMGRIYIILGEPKDIGRYENISNVYPVIVWFYSGMVEYALPNTFNVAFFKRDGIGEYQLYSPIKFGPQQLIPNYRGDMTDYIAAYYELLSLEPQVAAISLSLIPGESRQLLSPSLASEILIAQKVPAAPFEKVKDSYAEKLLKYKDIVEVDYSANFIESDSLAEVIQDPSGIYFVHFLIEPQKLTFVEYLGRYNSNLEINGSVTDQNDRTIYQFERKIPIEFDESQMAGIRSKLFSYQDMFPLVEGNYSFNLLLKNTVSKEFTSVEKRIVIPDKSALQIDPIVLANRLDKDSQYKGKNKPFMIGGFQLLPSPRNDFAKEDTLFVYFQIRGLSEDLQRSGFIRCAIIDDSGQTQTAEKKIGEYPDPPHFFEEFPLKELPAAYYHIRVSLLDGEKQEICSEQKPFYVTPLGQLPRPWLVSMPMPASDDPLIFNTLGNQYLNKQDLPRARTLLENAYRMNPQNLNFSLDYSRALFAAQEFQAVKQVAAPFLNDERKYPLLQILGQSCQALGELAEAIAHYKEYLNYYGSNLKVLNDVGKCYLQLGNREEALIAWERSLELDPNQEELRATVKSLKEKK